MNTVSRNQLCPCGSQIKYKKCCGKPSESEINENIKINNHFQKFKREGTIKHCIYPDKTNCSSNIIQAHTIQNNRILSVLSENGKIMMFAVTNQSKSKIFFDLDEVGKKSATTITAFCGYHDNKIFEAIEESEYQEKEQQNFLFAYRAFAYEYQKKYEAQKTTKSLTEVYGKHPILSGSQLGTDICIEKDIAFYKKFFDKKLISNEFDGLVTIVLPINEKISFAVTSGFALEYDLKGEKLNVLENVYQRLRLVFLNIFPCDINNKSYILLSFIEEDLGFYKGFIDELSQCSEEEIKTIFNNIIPMYCENFVLSPKLCETFSKEAMQELRHLFLSEGTPDSNKKFTLTEKRSLRKGRKYNLFDLIN